MKASGATPQPDRELARLIRRSRILDAPTRRQWLRVLPYLSEADRERLRQILLSEAEASVDRSPPGRPA